MSWSRNCSTAIGARVHSCQLAIVRWVETLSRSGVNSFASWFAAWDGDSEVSDLQPQTTARIVLIHANEVRSQDAASKALHFPKFQSPSLSASGHRHRPAPVVASSPPEILTSAESRA